jgi:hypothetical protein
MIDWTAVSAIASAVGSALTLATAAVAVRALQYSRRQIDALPKQLQQVSDQIALSTKTARIGVASTLNERLDGLNRVLLDRPDLIKQLNDMPPDDVSYEESPASIFMNLRLSLYELVVTCHEEGILTDEEYSPWRRTFLEAMRSPFAREYWRRGELFWGAAICSEINALLAEADRVQATLTQP